MEFSRQEYWNGLPFPPARDLPNLGNKFMSPALTGGFFTTGATWEACSVLESPRSNAPRFLIHRNCETISVCYFSSSVLGLIWVSLGFLGGSVGKESICIAGDLGLIPGLGRSPGDHGCKESDTTERLSLLGFPGAQMVKNLPAMQETWVQSLGW